MLLVTVLAAISLMRADDKQSRGGSGSAGQSKLTRLYLTRIDDIHFYPYWQAGITEISEEPGGVVIDYVDINAATQPCNDPSVENTRAHLRGASLRNIVKVDVCSLSPNQVAQAVEKARGKLEIDVTSRAAIVAECGDEKKVFQLPTYQLNAAKFKAAMPSAVPLLKLQDTILRAAWSDDGEMTLLPVETGSELMAKLKSGSFDDGFWYGSPGGMHPSIIATVSMGADPTVGAETDRGKLKNTLAKYKHAARGTRGRKGSLIDSGGRKLVHYVAPVYSPLAEVRRIEGVFVLELDVAANGAVEKVGPAQLISDGRPRSGELWLLGFVEDAVRQWTFEPGSAEKIQVRLGFYLFCEEPDPSQPSN